MTPPTFNLLQGDVLEVLRSLPDASVHMAMTSPPYWVLRDYKIEPSVWGGDPRCKHRWVTRTAKAGFCSRCSAWRGTLGLEPTPELYVQHLVEVFREVRRVLRDDGTLFLNLGDGYSSGGRGDREREDGQPKNPDTLCRLRPDAGLKPKDLCMMPARVALALQADGWYLRSVIPWLKHNGMPESTTDRPTSMVEYIFLLAKSARYFYDREAVRMVSSLNTHDRGNGVNPKAMGPNSRMCRDQDPQHQTPGRIRAKQNRSFSAAVHAVVSSRSRRNSDWFFESAENYSRQFQGLLVDADGDPLAMIVNPQPFAVEMCDACTQVYDQRDYRGLAVLLSCECGYRQRGEPGEPEPLRACPACGADRLTRHRVCHCGAVAWISHFATFPEQIVSPCIALGTSEHGVCPVCGAPWVRVVEKPSVGDWHPDRKHKHDQGAVNGTAKWAKGHPKPNAIHEQCGAHADFPAPATVGWRPGCDHPGHRIPAVVLDPFAGSGRAGLAALKLGRSFVGAERNPDYVRMAEWQAERLMETLKPQETEPAVPSPETPSSLAVEEANA